jgi:hypothetical protein
VSPSRCHSCGILVVANRIRAGRGRAEQGSAFPRPLLCLPKTPGLPYEGLLRVASSILVTDQAGWYGMAPTVGLDRCDRVSITYAPYTGLVYPVSPCYCVSTSSSVSLYAPQCGRRSTTPTSRAWLPCAIAARRLCPCPARQP